MATIMMCVNIKINHIASFISIVYVLEEQRHHHLTRNDKIFERHFRGFLRKRRLNCVRDLAFAPQGNTSFSIIS